MGQFSFRGGALLVASIFALAAAVSFSCGAMAACLMGAVLSAIWIILAIANN